VEIEKEKREEPNIRASSGYLSKLTFLLVFFFPLKVWNPKKKKKNKKSPILGVIMGI
jgi:hypothetical protein